MAHFDDIYDIAADGYGIITAAQAPAARPRRVQARALSAHAPTTPTPRPWRSGAAGPTCMASPCSPCTAWSWSTRAQSRSRRRSERAQGRAHHVLRGHPLPARGRRHKVLRRLGDARPAPRDRQAGVRRGPGHRRRVRKIGKGAGMTRPITPNSRRNLDLAIDRLCAKTGDEPGRANGDV